MTIMKSEPLSEALNFPKKGEMLRGVKVLDAKSKFRSPIFEYQITFPKGTKTKDIPAMLKQFFNTQVVNADKNYMVTHHDYRVKPFEGNVCVVGSMQLIEMVRTNPSVKLQEFDKHYSEMEMTNPETFFRKFKCTSFNSPQFRAQLFSYVSYMGENYGYSIDGCIYHRRASLIMPKIKITKAIPQAKMMYHTHPSKDEPSLSSADDYLLYFDLSHKPRSIRHFYTVMKDRMDYFQITPKKDSKADYVKLSEDKIIDEINAELDDLEERWAEKIPKDTGHANDMKFCENITRDLVKWINKKYKNYFKVKYTCYHRVRKNPETLEADDLHLGDEFIAKALNDIKTGEYSWPTFNSSAMPHEKYAYWHQMYYDHHVRDSFMTLGVNMPPGSDRRMNYYLQSKAPESEANYSDLLNILNISHDIAASDSKITDGGKVNSRIAEVAEYLELPTNVIDDLKLLEEIIYTMDVVSEEAKTLAGDYYGIVLLANYSINAVNIMNQVHDGKLDLTIAKQDVYHNLKMKTQEALSSFFVQKNRQDGIRINPAITIAKLELVTKFPREAFDYYDIVEEALAQFSKSRIDPNRSFYVKNTKMMYLSVPTSKGDVSINLSCGTGRAQIFTTKIDDAMEAAIEAVNKVGMALYRNGAQGIDPNEFSVNVVTPLMNPQPKVIIISGPSGAGKSTTIRNLLRRLPNAKTAPSYTTRQSRKSDKPGEKVFLSKEKFVKKLESGDMIAARLQKNGHYYGRLRSDFDHSGYVIVDVNLSGLRDIKREFPKALTAYLEPVEDPKFIERRLLMRGDMSPQEAKKRSSIIPSHIQSSKKINFDMRIKTRQGYFNEASDKILERLPRSNPDHTKQGKLPKELTEGADVSELSADDWFTKEGKKKLDKKRKAKQKKQAKDDEDEHSKSRQTRLFEEARAQGIEDATEIVEEEIEDNPRIPKKYEGQDPKDCPPATQDLALNTKNRDAAVKAEHIQYGPLNLNDKDYWTRYGKRWNTSAAVAKKSNCSNCIAFDISPRMKDCMPGKTSDKDGELGYCWMHHFKCHSARTCYTWAAGGPIDLDKVSSEWQDRAFPKSNPNTTPFAVFVVGKVGDKYTATTRDDGRIGLPGGKVDPGESGEVAAMREATEEGWSFPAGTNLTLIHQQDVDGNPVEWYMADTTPSPLSEYKEQHRGIRPILITAEQLKASGFGNENLPLYNPKKTPEGRKIPKRYLKGLNKEEMLIAAKEIDKGYKYDISDPKAYEYWKSDIQATARGYKTVPSKYKKKFIEMYGPLPEKGEFLDKMAKATKIKKSILQKVYDKGLAAWRGGHRPGVQQHQWAAGRVYSFVTLGNTVKKGNKKMPDHSLAIKAGLIKDNPRGNPSNQEVIEAGYLQGVNDVIEVVEDETEDSDNPDVVIHGDFYNFRNLGTIQQSGKQSRVGAWANPSKKPKTIRIEESPNKEKKLVAYFYDKDGNKFRTVHFGARGMSDFTQHKDPKRMKNYLARHAGMGENWKDPMTAGALSRWILWGKPSLRESFNDFKKRFNLEGVMAVTNTRMNPHHCPIEAEARRAATDPSFKHHKWYVKYHLDYVMAIAHALKPRAQPDEKEIINHMVWMHDYPKMMGDKDNFELVRNLVSKYKGKAYADELVGYLEDMEMIKSVDSMYGVETTIFALIMSTADALAHYYGPFFQIYHDENPDMPIEELKQKNAMKLEKDKRKLRAGPMEDGLDGVKFQYKGRKVRVVGNEHIADLIARKNPSDWRHGKFSEEDPFEEYFEE